MKTRFLLIGLISILLFLSDCGFDVSPSISTNGGSISGYGPQGYDIHYDTLHKVDIKLDTVLQINDTSLQYLFNIRPKEDLIIKNIFLDIQNVNAFVENEYSNWDTRRYYLGDFKIKDCYTSKNANPFYYTYHDLNSVQDSIYNFCVNGFPLSYSGYEYRIKIAVFIIRPGSMNKTTIDSDGNTVGELAYGGVGIFYYTNP